MVELPAPPHLAALLRLWEEKTLNDPTSDLWRDWIGEDAQTWHARNAELAEEALKGDDGALVELVRRDPRYVATELVVAKIVEADITFHNARDSGLAWLQANEVEDRALFEKRIAHADDFLDQLGKAVARRRGRGGARPRCAPSEVLSFLSQQKTALRRLWDEGEVATEAGAEKICKLGRRARHSMAYDDDAVLKLAAAFEASKEGVLQLLSSPTGAIETAAIAATAEEFGIEGDSVRRIVQRNRYLPK